MFEADAEEEWSEEVPLYRGKKRTLKRRGNFLQKRKCCCLLLAISLLLVVAIVILLVLLQITSEDSTYTTEKLIAVLNSYNSECWMPVDTPDTLQEGDIRCSFLWAPDNQRTEYADATLFSGGKEDHERSLSRFFAYSVPYNPNTQIVYANCRPIVAPLLREWSQMHTNFPHFTLTMTQKLDSDIVVRNYTIRSRNSSTELSTNWLQPTENWYNASLFRKVEVRRGFVIGEFEKQTNGIRDKLLMDLHKYAVSVEDISICWRNIFPCGDSYDQYSIKTHKFYLAFEEDLCTDHITDNFYRALLLNVVPVVFGGANYSRIAPPHSYINAEDFESTRELVDYLSYLDQHPQEYLQYFWWHDFYEVVRVNPLMELCRRLHSTDAMPRRIEKEFWTSSNCRTSTKLLAAEAVEPEVVQTERAVNGSRLGL